MKIHFQLPGNNHIFFTFKFQPLTVDFLPLTENLPAKGILMATLQL
jgi:hypothetical protein